MGERVKKTEERRPYVRRTVEAGETGSRSRIPDPPPGMQRDAPGYRVRIVYTEPEFQERNPQCPPEFSFTCHYPRAGTPQEAVKLAVDYFDFCAHQSSVAWRRIIKSVTVELP